MLGIINGATIIGIDAMIVRVEVDVSNGLPAFDIVGLPDASVRESKERVRTAIRNSGFEFPLKRITVNLAPADIKKEGALLDMPIAIGILLATEQINENPRLNDILFAGSLSLDGNVQPIYGSLSMAIAAKNKNLAGIALPVENSREASFIEGIDTYPIANLRDLVRWLNNKAPLEPVINEFYQASDINNEDKADMSDIKGQEAAKRALTVAAAGKHNVLMIGPPGSGKTMLARRMPTILPEMTQEEQLQTTRIYSASGLMPKEQFVIDKRPFRTPHHSASGASIIGGGRVPQAGEVSLAHNGILFLDELPEFHRDVLEALRQPLEDKVVSITRVNGRMEFPAGFQLIAAMNPCPCGHYNDPFIPCKCTPTQLNRYMGKISGPLLDRIDMHINVQRVEYKDMAENITGESSEVMKARVEQARDIQKNRFAAIGLVANADMTHSQISEYCKMTTDAENLLQIAFGKLNLSARAYDRILKVARTIADLDASDIIEAKHIAEAIQYRSLDKRK